MKKLYRRWLSPRLHMYLAYIKNHRRWPNLRNPARFSEKILWTKLYGALGRYGRYVDKYAVRDYVTQTIGVRYLNALLAVYENAAAIDVAALPERFVLKATHGCGCNIICKNKTDLDAAARRTLDAYLQQNYFYDSKEPQYRDITPRIIAEAYLEDAAGRLIDYKLHCFDGRVELIHLVSDRFANIKYSYRDREWKQARASIAGYPESFTDCARPDNLSEMILIAEQLAAPFAYVRVDLYNVDGAIYFGELTFTPGGGIVEIEPLSESLRLARCIPLSGR